MDKVPRLSLLKALRILSLELHNIYVNGDIRAISEALGQMLYMS
jgi:hypothetical protein